MTPRPGMKLEPPPILVPVVYLDDDPVDADALVASLGAVVDNPVETFQDPRQLFDYLDMNTGPFIILVDLVLFTHFDAGGGYDVLKRLRQRPDIINTMSPIIGVTGAVVTDPAAAEDLYAEVRKAGADAFIPKPVQVADLVEVVGKPGWWFKVGLSRPS